jgi:hypothetical protein
MQRRRRLEQEKRDNLNANYVFLFLHRIYMLFRLLLLWEQVCVTQPVVEFGTACQLDWVGQVPTTLS